MLGVPTRKWISTRRQAALPTVISVGRIICMNRLVSRRKIPVTARIITNVMSILPVPWANPEVTPTARPEGRFTKKAHPPQAKKARIAEPQLYSRLVWVFSAVGFLTAI